MACGKEKEKEFNAIGRIIGYNKCSNFEYNNGFVFGICIKTEQNDSLIAYNIPHSVLNLLLDLNISDLEQGVFYLNREIPPITFDYRVAKEHEIITIICPQTMMSPIFIDVSNFMQIIITTINNEEIVR
jgi:hypothetical protein